MHPSRMIHERNKERLCSSDKKVHVVNLQCLPAIKNMQLKCTLIGGSTEPQSKMKPLHEIPAEFTKSARVITEEKPVELVPVVVVVKCPCCKKITSKETKLISSSDNDYYYHSFVEASVPGIIKYEACDSKKCKEVKLLVVK